jgi:hypothetical protein
MRSMICRESSVAGKKADSSPRLNRRRGWERRDEEPDKQR